MWVITGMPTSAVRDVVPPLTLADIEKRAKDKLPGHVYDFYASGSDDEQTLLHNIGAFKKYTAIILQSIAHCELTCSIGYAFDLGSSSMFLE